MEPEVKTQQLLTTRFVGLARQGHPIFDGDITPQRFAAFPTSASRAADSTTARWTKPWESWGDPPGQAGLRNLPLGDLRPARFRPAVADRRALLWRANRLGLGLRQFDIPVPLKTVMVVQAWHPRFDNDPAHRWFRQTVKRLCEEVQNDPHPLLGSN